MGWYVVVVGVVVCVGLGWEVLLVVWVLGIGCGVDVGVGAVVLLV